METLTIDYGKLISECKERGEKAKARADKADYFYHMKCAEAIENMWNMDRVRELDGGKRYGVHGVQKRKLLERALKIWGEEAQTRKLSEEMAELWVEICHMQLGRGEMDKLAEEIADVRIMLDQMDLLFCYDGVVSDMMDKKLERLAERLGL